MVSNIIKGCYRTLTGQNLNTFRLTNLSNEWSSVWTGVRLCQKQWKKSKACRLDVESRLTWIKLFPDFHTTFSLLSKMCDRVEALWTLPVQFLFDFCPTINSSNMFLERFKRLVRPAICQFAKRMKDWLYASSFNSFKMAHITFSECAILTEEFLENQSFHLARFILNSNFRTSNDKLLLQGSEVSERLVTLCPLWAIQRLIFNC